MDLSNIKLEAQTENDFFDNMIEDTIHTTFDYSKYKENTYEIVSKIAYLIGVEKKNFESEHEPLKYEIYENLDKDTAARIIRNLCILRTSIERGFGYILDKMKYEYATILNIPEKIPQFAINQLEADGVHFYKNVGINLNQHVIDLNRLISDRINNCRHIFPVWINWEYIKNIFIIPNGLCKNGVKEAVETYYENKSSYPYQAFINWKPDGQGNILFNDEKFVTLLYKQNGDMFQDYNRVTDAGSYVKGNIYDFIDEANKVIMVVDCENSDPYRLCAVLNGLGENKVGKIQKIMLVDDVHTVAAWKILESFTKIPVEHIMTERVKQEKSLVDIELTARTCREHYKNNVDSIIIVSSDSDYWGLISSLPDAKFQVMIEKEKCSNDMKNALVQKGIFYCYMDNFYAGNSDDIKNKALLIEMNNRLAAQSFNITELFEQTLQLTRIEMSATTKKQFFDKYIKNMHFEINENGEVKFRLKHKR